MKKTILILLSTLLLGTGCSDDDYGTVKVKNHKNSNTDIKEIFYKRSHLNSWGSNQLTGDELKPNESERYILRCKRKYDFRVVYLDDSIRYIRKENLGCDKTLSLVFKD